MRAALILTLTAVGLAGCNSEETSGGPYLAATVDGARWYAGTSDGLVYYGVDNPDEQGLVYTISTRAEGTGLRFIVLNLPYPVTPGAYPLDGFPASAVYGECPTEMGANDCQLSSAVASDVGSLTITSVDSTTEMIEGRFSFTGHLDGASDGRTVAVRNGAFAIHLAALGIPPS